MDFFKTSMTKLTLKTWLMWSINRRRAVNVLSLVARDATVPELAATTREGAIEELCAGLGEIPGVHDVQTCVDAVRARESLIGTGTGGGLAIPHAKLGGITRPVLVFGRSEAGIDWDAPDGEPVHLVFLLLSPVDEHGLQLQILAALARGLAHGAVRELLIEATTESRLWAALQGALAGQSLEHVPA